MGQQIKTWIVVKMGMEVKKWKSMGHHWQRLGEKKNKGRERGGAKKRRDKKDEV